MKKGWEVKQLGQLCKYFGDGDWIESKDQSSDGVRLIQTGNVGEGFFKDRGERARFITNDTFKRLRCTEIFEHDCLISRLPDPIGRACLLPKTDERMITAVDCTILRFNSNLLLPQFFVYYSQSASYLNDVERESTGTTRKRISRKKLGEVFIPLPPLSEQHRIVTILDEAIAAIAKAKENAEKNLANAQALFKSNLQSVFADRTRGGEEKPLGEVADTWGRIGWKGLTAKEYTQEGPLFLSVYSLNYGDYVDFRDAFHISQERYDESPEIMLRPDDILICKDGAGIGKLGIVPRLSTSTTINSSLLLIRGRDRIITKYLFYNLLSPIFQSIVQSRLMGATTPHLYQRDIVTFPILLPSLKVQRSIVSRLDSLSTETKKLELIYQQKLTDLEELKKSILEKAFRGELTPDFA